MKLHFPPKTEDAVNLIDHVFDKAVEATRPIKELAFGVKAIADGLQRLAAAVSVLAHNQAVHHNVIQQMYGVQQFIYKKLTENSMDVSLPDIKVPQKIDPKDVASVTAAEARKHAENKPN